MQISIGKIAPPTQSQGGILIRGEHNLRRALGALSIARPAILQQANYVVFGERATKGNHFDLSDLKRLLLEGGRDQRLTDVGWEFVRSPNIFGSLEKLYNPIDDSDFPLDTLISDNGLS